MIPCSPGKSANSERESFGHKLNDCDVQDTLSAGDRCPSKMLLQEDVSVLSEVDDLLLHWEVEAEVALGAEWGSGTAQSWAEP